MQSTDSMNKVRRAGVSPPPFGGWRPTGGPGGLVCVQAPAAAVSTQIGFSLIEVLVAILIFSVAVLGIALMQLKGSQYTKQAGARTVAVIQARSLAEAMRANPAGVYGVASVAAIASKNGDLSGSYYLFNGNAAPSGSGCSNAACQQAAQDLSLWISQLEAGTPSPSAAQGATVYGAIAPDPAGTGQLVITSTWNGMRPDSTGKTINDSYQFNFQP